MPSFGRDCLVLPQKCVQRPKHEFGPLIDDPMSGVVDRFDLDVTHAICIATQQRRSDHWIMLRAQNPNGPIDAASVVLAAKPPRNLAHQRASARRCIARNSFLRTT
jgi:hypothetical protein